MGEYRIDRPNPLAVSVIVPLKDLRLESVEKKYEPGLVTRVQSQITKKMEMRILV
ncbi:MAG TPA: hypothetical protein VFI73_13940 [Candidatus Nitrosopolaris sp.]|nr:hypothetical protein [Candidatus Nitrosopolaris sp.]